MMCLVQGNGAGAGAGGAVWVYRGTATLSNCVFSENTAQVVIARVYGVEKGEGGQLILHIIYIFSPGIKDSFGSGSGFYWYCYHGAKILTEIILDLSENRTSQQSNNWDVISIPVGRPWLYLTVASYCCCSFWRATSTYR
jgi:hypothetical protein